METYKLGLNEASKLIIISRAFTKQIQLLHNSSDGDYSNNTDSRECPSKAIDRLTSCLTTMKLLGKVESQTATATAVDSEAPSLQKQQQQHLLEQRQSSIGRTASWQSIQSCVSEKSNEVPSATNAAATGSKRKLHKSNAITTITTNTNISSASKTTKKTKKERDVDVAQKVILQKTKNGVDPNITVGTTTTNMNSPNNSNSNKNPTSPSSSEIANNVNNHTHGRKRTASPRLSRGSKRDLESMVQSTSQQAKRQRLDSI